MKNFFYFLLLAILYSNTISAQLNTELLAELDYTNNLSDVWGYTAPDGTEYALVGVRNGLSIVSLEDPDDPVEVDFVPGDNSVWRDIKTWDEHAYIVADQGNDGMTVVDLTNLPGPVTSSQWTPNIAGLGTLTRCHNLYIDENGKAFLTGCNINGGGPFVVDVFTDADSPSFIDIATNTYAHDIFVQDNILYSSEIYAGTIAIYDVEDLNNINFLGSQSTPRNFTHNAWANEDGSLVFTTDEKANAPTAAFNIEDPQNIELLDEFRPLESLGSGVIPHNVHFRNDYLIISHYTDGVVIVDAIDPSNLIEVGNYDTWAGGDGGFSGAWGAFPFFDTDKILVSDISNGLFVLDATYTRAARIEGKVTDFISGAELNNVDVEIISSQLNATQTNASGDYKTGQEQGGLHSVQFSKNGYLTHTQEEVLIKGESVTIDIQLVPLTAVFSASGQVTEFPSGDPIEGAQLVLQNDNYYFQATSDSNGAFNFPQVVQGTYDLIGGNWGHLQNSVSSVTIFSNITNENITLNKGYQDDFIADLEWILEDFSEDGAWVIGEPRGTMSNGNQANPEEDANGDFGNRAYVTGNGGVEGNDNDLDGGPTRLTSQNMDLSIYNQPILNFDVWFFNNISGSTNDFYEIKLNNGNSINLLESISTSSNGWESLTFDLNDLVEVTDNMTLEFQVADSGGDDLIEAGLDRFLVEEGTPFIDFSASVTEGCGPLGVQFTDNNNNSVSWNWQFEGGSPEVSNQQHPFVVFNSPGSFSVTLQFETWDGQVHTIIMDDLIEVFELPTADFDYTIDGRTVEFTNQSTNYDSINWDFGDGEMSSEINPVHEYDADGEYTVILTSTNECGEAGSILDIIIATLPTSNFTSDIESGCAPFDVSFTSLSSPNTDSYFWEFEGGSPATSTEENPIVSYNEEGVFDVTLIANNEVGSDTITFSNYIGVSILPTANFNFQIDGQDVSFDNSSENAFEYEWQFGDNETSEESDPIHTYSNDGIYEVILISFNGCGSDTTSLTIEISNFPVANFSSDTQSGCAELTIQYQNLSSSNSSSFSWTFQGGSPTTSNAENPLVTYSTAGTYDVSLIASNEFGNDTMSFQNYIGVSDIPNASYGFTIDDREVNFVNTSNGAINYEWQFGDGQMSSEENVLHIYSADGEYEVLLIAFNACGPDTMTQNITVSTPPTALFEANITSACLPQEIQFMDLSSSNTDTWNWTFDGAEPSSSNEQNPSVLYTSPGTFNVELNVTNETGTDTYVLSKYITIDDIPGADFYLEIDDFELTANNESSNYDQISWDLGDGTLSNEESVNHTYSEEGIYLVSLFATNECGTDTHVVQVKASLLPSAGFSSNTSAACLPAEIQFNDNSSANVTEWEWFFEGGSPSTSNQQNPLIDYPNTGTFDVELIVKSLGGADTISISDAITINDVPTANFSSSSQFLMVEFENLSQNYTQVKWEFGDGQTSEEVNPIYEYDEDGDYSVLLIVSNECGSDSFDLEVKVASLPQAGFEANTLFGCAPMIVDFISVSSPNSISFNWEFEGGNPANSNMQNPTTVYNEKGSYRVQLIVGSEAGFDTLAMNNYIIVDDVPESDFEVDMNLLEVNFTNNTSNALSYDWSFGDGQLSQEENPSHTYDTSGDYEVQLISLNECGLDSLTKSITVSSTSIIDPGFDFEINLAPNPFQDFTTLTFELDNAGSSFLELKVYDLQGKILEKQILKSNQGQVKVGDGLTNGIYLIYVMNNKGSIWTEKLLKF